MIKSNRHLHPTYVFQNIAMGRMVNGDRVDFKAGVLLACSDAVKPILKSKDQ